MEGKGSHVRGKELPVEGRGAVLRRGVALLLLLPWRVVGRLDPPDQRQVLLLLLFLLSLFVLLPLLLLLFLLVSLLPVLLLLPLLFLVLVPFLVLLTVTLPLLLLVVEWLQEISPRLATKVRDK